MIQEILTYPKNKDILTLISQPVLEITDDILNIISDMKDTLNNTKGCGISAIQIGHPLKICIIKINGQQIVMINPKITRTRGEKEYKEGCLSVPNVFLKTKRFYKVWCEYQDEFGNTKEIDEGGLMSIIIQHELDHFDGKCKLFEIMGE